MKRVFFIVPLLLVIASLTANAQLYCRNETDKAVWLTLAYNYVPADVQLVSSGDTWITEGWFYIPANGVVQLTSHIGYDRVLGTKSNFFYYAEQQGGREWYGARRYLIDHVAERNPNQLSFRIEKAQNKGVYKDVPQLILMPFKGATNTRESQYTFVLRQDDKNEGLIVHDEEWNNAFNKGQIPVIKFAEDQ